ncbi:hypothetical protein [Phenylobacterium sp.]|uniref:hypothetical protein n=1 Tax=Phenylobacterium sp. TaxID=1871053 RepID=UPI0025FF97F0|nr:hypothetical protein [Phenylobacterium sp.]
MRLQFGLIVAVAVAGLGGTATAQGYGTFAPGSHAAPSSHWAPQAAPRAPEAPKPPSEPHAPPAFKPFHGQSTYSSDDQPDPYKPAPKPKPTTTSLFGPDSKPRR